METKKQYRIAADFLRILSILAVIFIHSTTKTLEASVFALEKIPLTLFLNQILRFAVPLFFMISGFVLELNYHLNENCLTFLKKRLNRVFIPYIFWSFIYYFFVFNKKGSLNFLDSLLRGNASYQLYFIPALLIFYLLFPLIHNFCEYILNKWIVIIFGLIQIVALYIEYNINPLPIYSPAKVAFLNFYVFFLGIVFARNQERFLNFIKKWKLLLLLGSIASAVFVFYEGLSGYLKTHNYLTFYSSWRPSILIYTILLAGFLYWVFDRKIIKTSLVKTLARLSFFVFFIHVIILETLWHLIGINIFRLKFAKDLWFDPICFIAVALISFLIAYIAHKIPYLSKLTG